LVGAAKTLIREAARGQKLIITIRTVYLTFRVLFPYFQAAESIVNWKFGKAHNLVID
jgi:hypothetical protein